MDNTVNTSITVTFVSETAGVAEDHTIAVELDEERNDSKSQFLFGEKAYFRIFTNPADMKIEIETTAGIIADEGTGVYVGEDTAIFQNSKTASTPKPIKQLLSYEWLGKSLGAVMNTPAQIIAQKAGIGVLKYQYTADFKRKSLKLNSPGADILEYPVVVFIREVV